MLILLCLLFFLLPEEIHAQVINEVFPNPSGDESVDEWIEIYNPEDCKIDLDGYLLEDKAGHQMVIDEASVGDQLIISPKGFLGIKRNGSELSLNNSNEEIVFLYTDKNKTELVDQFSYNGSETDRSWGKIPDGSVINESSLQPSFGAENIVPPTPTPKPTVTPTKIPTPTNTPTPSSTPTSTPTLAKTSTPTPVATSKLTDEDIGDDEETEHNSEEKVLSIRKEMMFGDDSSHVLEEGQDKTRFPVAALAIILGGISFVGAGTFPFLKSRLKEKKGKDRKEKDVKIQL